jgi:hypothetical protein
MEYAEYTSHYLLDTRPWPRHKCRRGFLFFMAIHDLPSWELTSASILSSEEASVLSWSPKMTSRQLLWLNAAKEDWHAS